MKSSSSSKMPSIYKPSNPPSRIYNRESPYPQVVQTEQTLGQSIKQGFGALIGWKIGSILFGNPTSNTTYEVKTLPSMPNDKCFDYRELLGKCMRNGGDWSGNNDCSKFIELLQKCEKDNITKQ